MLIAGKNIHVFVYSPWTGSDGIGITVRIRSGSGWWHYRLNLFEKALGRKDRQDRTMTRHGQRFMSRPNLKIFEISRYKTINGIRERSGLKQYIRLTLKASAGGRQLYD